MLLKKIILQTKNIDELHAFYKNVLQFKVVRSDPESIIINAGITTLVFEKTKGLEKPFYHFAFNIPSNKFEEAFEWLKNSG